MSESVLLLLHFFSTDVDFQFWDYKNNLKWIERIYKKEKWTPCCLPHYTSTKLFFLRISQVSVQFSLVAQSCPTLWDPHEPQHTRLPFPSLSPRVCSNSCPLSQWCHPTISSSVTPFSYPQSLPASVSFPVNWLCVSGGQNIGASASASFLPVNIQSWFPSGLTDLIFCLRDFLWVFCSTTIQKHQFFSTQPSLWSNSHIHTWPQEKP